MSISRRTVLMSAAAMMMAPSFARAQQAWPSRAIRLVVNTSPGGSPDLVARLLGQTMSGPLGTSVVVENLSGSAAWQSVASHEPDGYMLGLISGAFATQAAVSKSLPFDPLADFTFVSQAVRYPIVYLVPKDSPITSFPDLIERAKAAPGKLTYVRVGTGSVYHLLGTWIDNVAGTSITGVPYRGTAASLTDVMAGRVDVLSEAATSAIPRVVSGEMRALAVSSSTRYPLMPDIPTMSEFLPGISAESWLGIVAPANTPDAIVQRLNQEVRAGLETPAFQTWAKDSGIMPEPSTPEGFRALVESDIEQWAKIVEHNGIQVEN